MATTDMYRLVTTVTGVAGSPYYMVGYFEAEPGQENNIITAWHLFCVPASSALPVGATATTSGLIDVVNPVSGDTVGVQQTTDYTTGGTYAGETVPRASQVLVRWRTGVYVGGREIRGRTNIPLVEIGAIGPNGGLDGAFLSVFNERAEDLVNDPASSFVIWSKKNGRHEPVVLGSTWSQFSVLTSRRD